MSIGLRDLLKKLRQPVEIGVGFPKEKQVVYPPDERPWRKDKGGKSVGFVASVQEYGCKFENIPSRPFLHTAMTENRDKIQSMLKNYITSTDSTYLDKIGITLVNMVKDSIKNGDWIPNSQKTKFGKLTAETRRLFFSGHPTGREKVLEEFSKMKPLIDRGIMINSVSYAIRRG